MEDFTKEKDMCAGQVLNPMKYSKYSYNKKSKDFEKIKNKKDKENSTATEVGGSDACQVFTEFNPDWLPWSHFCLLFKD